VDGGLSLKADDELRSSILQVLMLGFRGLTVQPQDMVSTAVSAGVGSVVLFDVDGPSGFTLARNVESPTQVADLCQQLHAASPYQQLLIAIDMEGGLVCRLKEQYGYPPTQSAQDLGTGDPQQTYEAAAGIADTLARAGINLNLAPCIDVDVNPDNPVIGSKKRSYSADPEWVAEHAAAFVRAHRDRGILTCLKHFPGHGSSHEDSHVGFTDVTKTWSRDELIPFRRLIEQGLVDAVMTAHVVNSQLDEVPATLSGKIIDKLLRNELGFDGVVISDDMGMGAITAQYGLAEAVIGALNSGVDMLALANQGSYEETIVERVIDIITDAITTGRLERSRLESAAGRVRHLLARPTENRQTETP
jgi:beta-N-acetylhexosaminidase